LPDYVTTLTKWIVAFLIIFLLCIVLLFTFLYNSKTSLRYAAS
jgi:hypothetical protein